MERGLGRRLCESLYISLYGKEDQVFSLGRAGFRQDSQGSSVPPCLHVSVVKTVFVFLRVFVFKIRRYLAFNPPFPRAMILGL